MNKKHFFKVIVSAIIFDSKNKFLLAKRSLTDDVLPGYWNLPGGKVDSNPEFILDVLEVNLKREVKEEVDLEIKNLKYLESYFDPNGKVNVSFTCTLKSGVAKPLEDTDEVGWFTLEEVKNLQLTPHTLRRLELALK
ncbi:MAG: NUDIX hydrolase [Candidatus ainarchaeum sp.]|nr:NUDIX hydrolase [Candidatus ainarchaeum sp.]